MKIRDEIPNDRNAIFALTKAAFAPMPYSDGSEPAIIDGLRDDGDLALSLVATEAGLIVGHIAFSPVTIDGVDNHWFGLGPVSVAVAEQGRGVGGNLIREGLARLKSLGANGCVLVGNPAYYCRFGFRSDGEIMYEGMPSEYVQWLSFDGTSPKGRLKYSPAFSAS